MDLTSAFALLDSDSEDEAPPFVVPDFFEEDDDESGNVVQLFGLAANYSADFQSGVRGADRSEIDEWYAERRTYLLRRQSAGARTVMADDGS